MKKILFLLVLLINSDSLFASKSEPYDYLSLKSLRKVELTEEEKNAPHVPHPFWDAVLLYKGQGLFGRNFFKKDDFVEDINFQDAFGNTILHYAVSARYNVINTLLKFGADPYITNKDGDTSLHAAAEVDNYWAVKRLLKFAKVSENGDAKHEMPLIEIKNKKGFSALSIASQKDSLNAAKVLLSNGADSNSVCLKGRTPLHWAAFKSTDVDQILVKFGARRNLKDSDGKFPLDLNPWWKAIGYSF